MNHLAFQYCPKIAVFSADGRKVLLCRRKGEQDYDGVFSLIGGKMEHSDVTIVDALSREKTEEVGESFAINVLPQYSVNVNFVKADGSHMILPHHLARHIAGAPVLNHEYSEFAWVDLGELAAFGPKVDNITWITAALKRLLAIVADDDFVTI
ncbi:NUDIX hydrolase [Lentzea aerocolonigenes]|uniref:NUDIX hydrolase n=1 Tax=Lentzea aerocolonigenes TaxID=68170 RepID=UPI000B059D57|nr:NUDIX domain-containing protein [Lentzea aerocolonigenes]MCP2242755.1 NUDIX domain-containing protein [Lentzea aerocolonigenes]